jgi:hypothetical protein
MAQSNFSCSKENLALRMLISPPSTDGVLEDILLFNVVGDELVVVVEDNNANSHSEIMIKVNSS